MKPRGPLMIEHRLIERMFEAVKREIQVIKTQGEASETFLDTVADFIRMYADKTHHGKEEHILFRDLAKKEMLPEDQQMLQELLDEHRQGRELVAELLQAEQSCLRGQKDALERIVADLEKLLKFYPEHIRKEDKIFFPRSEQYLTEPEQEAMIREFWEFDRKMIHEKYRSVVEQMERRQEQKP